MVENRCTLESFVILYMYMMFVFEKKRIKSDKGKLEFLSTIFYLFLVFESSNCLSLRLIREIVIFYWTL